MTHQKIVLPNGLRVITVPMPSLESATVMVMVGAGSRYEPKNINGISHFLEHMAFKGTTKRPTAQDIAAEIDGVGGEFNAFTEREFTGYHIKAPVEHLELMMDVLSDMLKNLKLDEVEIEKEKGVIIQELNLYEDTPMRNILDVYPALLYGDTPMGRDIGGKKEVIQKITRKDFVNYMNSLYSADNITIIVAGGIEAEKAQKLAEKYFADMKKYDIVGYTKLVQNQVKPALTIKNKDTEQVHMAVGFRTIPIASEEKYGFEVLSTILGGGMSSRLFSEVREKRGLAYYVRTTSDLYQDSGTFYATAGLDKSKVEEGIEVILAEFAKFAKGEAKITQKELSKAKEYFKGHFVLGLEDSHSVAWYYALAETLEKKIADPKEVIAKIEAITLEEVESLAKKYFKEESLNLAIIGNFSDRQKFEKLLKL